MNRAEAVVMALEACVKMGRRPNSDWYGKDGEILFAFAQLVASAEREACAGIVKRNAESCANNSILQDVLNGNAAAIMARGQQ